MRITGINESFRNNISVKSGTSSAQPSQDNYEINIRNQIKSLQEEKKNISNDDKLSSEQKAREKQAVQEQIQSLNSELRQYQIQKRQEEVQKKQETAGQITGKADEKISEKSNEKNADENQRVFGNEKLGVIITISLTKEQVANLEKVRKDLEGKQRTAETDEEKEKFQQKINNVSKGIGQKIIIAEDTILESQKPEKFGADQKKDKGDALKKDAAVIAGIDSDSKGLSGRNGFNNQDEMFENISVVVK